jgi:hypothetical protein
MLRNIWQQGTSLEWPQSTLFQCSSINKWIKAISIVQLIFPFSNWFSHNSRNWFSPLSSSCPSNCTIELEQPLKLFRQHQLIWRKLLAWSHSELLWHETMNSGLWSWEKSRIAVPIMSSFTWSCSWQNLNLKS